MELLDSHAHYNDEKFDSDREKVLKNTYSLNELLHKMDIDEKSICRNFFIIFKRYNEKNGS